MNRRGWLKSATSAAAIAALDGCVHAERPAGFDCVVYATAPARRASATCRSIAQALEQAARSDKEPFRILVHPGRYSEKLEVSRAGVDLIGTAREATVITFAAVAGARAPDGSEWGTAGSATLSVRAPRFRAAHLTIENAFDYPANFARPAGDPLRLGSPQAVALFTTAGSDCAQFHDVALIGYQDTVFVDSGRSYFRECRLIGHVDFIFGAGCALFEASDVVSRPRDHVPQGYVLAPSTSIHDPFGLVFHECSFMPESDQVRDGQTFLGRPWHPGRDFPDGRYADPDAVGAAVLLRCQLGRHIAAEAWTQMGGLARDGGRVMFKPEDARLFEFENWGPRAAPHAGRRQLSVEEAARFTPQAVLRGWKPQDFAAQ